VIWTPVVFCGFEGKDRILIFGPIMFRPKLYPSFSEVAKFRAARDGGDVGERVERVESEAVPELENSRDMVVRQMEREAFEMARSAKEVRRSKAIQQKADLEKRRQQFGEENVITFLLDTSAQGYLCK
jgi:hypothetical protein